MGQATGARRQRRRQPGGAAESFADAGSHSLAQADAAPPHTEPVGDAVPAPDRVATPDRDTAADRHADIAVPDRHPGARPHCEPVGNGLTAPAR